MKSKKLTALILILFFTSLTFFTLLIAVSLHRPKSISRYYSKKTVKPSSRPDTKPRLQPDNLDSQGEFRTPVYLQKRFKTDEKILVEISTQLYERPYNKYDGSDNNREHYGTVILTDGSIYRFDTGFNIIQKETEEKTRHTTLRKYSSIILDNLTEKTGDVPHEDLEKIKKYGNNIKKQFMKESPINLSHIHHELRVYDSSDNKQIMLYCRGSGMIINTDKNSENLINIICKHTGIKIDINGCYSNCIQSEFMTSEIRQYLLFRYPLSEKIKEILDYDVLKWWVNNRIGKD